MSRVLLLVQTGDARPKCGRGRVRRHPFHDGREYHNLGGTGHYGTCRMASAMARADRWWLVECENADAGRRVIAESLPDDDPACRGLRGDVEMGRILASGGRPRA